MEAKEKVEQQVAIQMPKTDKILFKILPVTIHGSNGSLDVHALLDDGSGPIMIEKNIIEKLNLKGKRAELCIRWTDGTVRVDPNSELLNLKVSPSGNQNKKILLRDVHTVENLSLPVQTMIVDEPFEKFSHLRGLPVQSYENVRASLIIGLNNKHSAIPMEFREGRIDEPAATKTRIGWTIFGAVDRANYKDNRELSQLHVCSCDDDVALNKLVSDSLKLEKSTLEGKENELAMIDLEKYEGLVERTENHFTSKLFWRSEELVLPDNFSMALKRLCCFERKLAKNPDLMSRVNALIPDMEQKQYVRRLAPAEIEAVSTKNWYLPKFSVHNPNKAHKTRIVWNDVIPRNCEKSWQEWPAVFPRMSSVRIPRCYFGNLPREGSLNDLHVFVDASADAYAAVAYIRIENNGR